MENEMIALPIVWALIGGTALLTSFVSATLPSWPKYWSAFIGAIKRVFTKRATTPIEQHNLEVIVEQINELREQMNNVAKNSYGRERNRKNNIRREVREYLKELQND